MPLNAITVRNLKASAKPTKHYDAAGLYLEVTPKAAKLWRLRYRLGGKQRLLSLGKYPAVSLAEARKARDEANALLAAGVDPSMERKARKAATSEQAGTLEAIAREWLATVHAPSVVPKHYSRNVRRLEKHIFPKLGNRPVAEIEPPILLEVLRAVVDQSGAETAGRIRTMLSQVWRYAIATSRATRDVAADLRDALPRAEVRHQPAITDPAQVAGLLRAIDGYLGQPTTVAALKLSAMLFVRPGELRTMQWADVDLDAATWNYRPSKDGRPLLTPLPRQAVALLAELEPVTGRQPWVFPSLHGRGRPMSENTVNAALRRMGYADTMTAHGFRAMARTILEEHLGFAPNVIEMQLGHAVRDANGRAYNRTTLLAERRAMLAQWADYLDSLAADSSRIG